MGSEDSECRLLIQTSLNNMSEIIFIIWAGEPRLRGNRGRKWSRTERKWSTGLEDVKIDGVFNRKGPLLLHMSR